MARGKKHYEPKRGKYKRDNQYIEISDDDTEEEGKKKKRKIEH